MKHLSRPYRSSLFRLGAVVLLAGSVIALPPGAHGQVSRIEQIVKQPSLLLHGGSQGYLGVLVGDVDADSAAKLKLKQTRGAVVTLIDHDAPAAQAGIRVNDVVLELNGKSVDNSEQFSRMLRELPAGRKVSLLISRDGNLQTLVVELADRKKMEHEVWSRIDGGGEEFSSVPSMGILSGGSGSGSSNAPLGNGFHLPFFGSTLNVGAMVEPLTSQMADYLGIQNGLMVKQVARKSPADAAGLRAFDVILKVGTETVNTVADWDRALRSNQGKPVQVTILRNKRQETLTLYVDSKGHHAELEDLLPDGDCPLVAALDGEMAQELGQELSGQAGLMGQQAEEMGQALQNQNFGIDQKQMDELRKQMEQFRQSFQADPFKTDAQQMEEMRQQMQQFQKQFKLDPKQMDELKKQMNDLKQQMEQFKLQGFGRPV